MDFSAGSSGSSASKVFYSQPSCSQSKVCEISQKGLENNSLSLPVTTNNFSTLPDNEVIVLYSDSEEEPELISTNNQLVFDKDKGKEREHSTGPVHGTIPSAVDIEQSNESELIDNRKLIAYDKGKGKEREHSIEESFGALASSAGSNSVQVDDDLDDDELVDMEIDYDIPHPSTIISNQLIIPWAIDTELNHASRDQQLGEEASSVEKVIRFFNLYNYTFDIFDIVIDLSNKYQEMFQEDSIHLKPYHNNPCILLELLSNLLSNRLNSANINNLEILATEYYEKLKSAEISRQGLYRTSFYNDNFHSTAKSLNEEKRSIANSRVNNIPPTTKDKKRPSKKVKRNKSSNELRIDLEKILSSTIQSPQNIEAKVPPLSLTDHLNKVVKSITQSSNFSLIRDSNLSVAPQGINQTFNSPHIYSTIDTNFPSIYETSNEQAMQSMASTSSVTGNHPVEGFVNGSQLTTNPNQITEIMHHAPREEWPIPDLSFEVAKEYKSMMADAIQKLAITNLVMKHNPESGPGELDSVVNKFEVKKIAKDSNSAHAYNESLINIFNHGGMDIVMERLEGNLSSHLKVKPKESRKQRKKRRLLQKQASDEKR